MLGKKEQKIIKECAAKYRVSSVFLFGSSLHSKGRDIDLAVKGIAPRLFFRFYGELFKALPRPVDLVDLGGKDNYFKRSILAEGKVIYEA